MKCTIKDWTNNIKTISEATIKRSVAYLRKQNVEGDENVKTIQIILLKKNGVCTYKNWFETIKWNRKGKNIILSTPNKFMFNYINTNFKKLIDLIWKNINVYGYIILKM